MPSVLELKCGQCGRPHADEDIACALCGHLLRTPPPAPEPVATTQSVPTGYVGTSSVAPSSFESVVSDDAPPRVLGMPEPWFYLTLGLVTAPLFSVTPLVRLIGWFLGALVHEMGHSLVAWVFGSPAFPAISLTAEAAAIHGEQSVLLVLLIWAGATYGAWRIPWKGVRRVVLPLAVVIYPVLAFTELQEVFFLVGGHLGELAFATLCLQRTLSGGFTESPAERGLYGTIGWFLVGSNLFLTVGLLTSASRRALYAANGSFGITNDYIRLAEDVLGMPLEVVALGMSLVALAAPVAGLIWWRLGRSDD
jgi:hypothetical protein